MRNIRNRRRFGLILYLLLAVCVILFIEDRIEAFVPEMKNFAEARIEKAAGGRIKFSIGDIDGGLFQPITFNDVKIKSGTAGAFPSLEVSSIKTEYRLWDIMNASSGGFFSARGRIDLASGGRINFIGKIKNGVFDIELKPNHGVIKAQGNFGEKGLLDANFKVYHLDIGGYDFTCEGVLKAENTAQGSVELKNCVLNYKPFLNLEASYKISGGMLEITNFSLSDIFKGHGTFQLREPFNINAVLTVNNLSLSWLGLALGAKNASSILSGTANIKCDFKGPLAGLRSNVKMEIRKGAIATLGFEYLSAHLKGEGPVIRIEDSRITRESGTFILAGDIDLRKIGKDTMFGNIRLVGDDKAINWDGWDTSKVQNIREVTMKKRINDDINLDFKKYTFENVIDESLKYGDEVQLEYKLHPNDSLKVMVGQDKEFLGIEHKSKF